MITREGLRGSSEEDYLIISAPETGETVAGSCLHQTYVPLSVTSLMWGLRVSRYVTLEEGLINQKYPDYSSNSPIPTVTQ